MTFLTARRPGSASPAPSAPSRLLRLHRAGNAANKTISDRWHTWSGKKQNSDFQFFSESYSDGKVPIRRLKVMRCLIVPRLGPTSVSGPRFVPPDTKDLRAVYIRRRQV